LVALHAGPQATWLRVKLNAGMNLEQGDRLIETVTPTLADPSA